MRGPRPTVMLTLEMAEKVADGAGGFAVTWQPLGTLWAEIDARTGRDTGAAGGPVSRTAYRITVRGAPSGTDARPVAGQRFSLGARRFPIAAVAERDPGGRYLICFCEEEIAQ